MLQLGVATLVPFAAIALVPGDLGAEVIAPLVQPQQRSQGRLEMLPRRGATLLQLLAGILVRL